MDALKSGNDALLEAAADAVYPCDFVGKNISEVLASAQLVHYPKHTERCIWCDGTGLYEYGEYGDTRKCSSCNGSGEVPVEGFIRLKKCDWCFGKGVIFYKDLPHNCDCCKGSGVVPVDSRSDND